MERYDAGCIFDSADKAAIGRSVECEGFERHDLSRSRTEESSRQN